MKRTTSQQQDNRTKQNPNIQLYVTALLSEKALAKDWLKPEEEEAWNYL
ncbi:MAG: hypothetical protein WC295_13575 [Methanoregula sp.]